MDASSSLLMQPFKLGDLALPNRVVMAPLTRNRAAHGSDVASDLAATYYRQRSSAGLIVSEGTQISQQGQGLRLDARPLQRQAGRGLAQGDRRGP